MDRDWLAKVEYGNFDLGRFRYDAAAMIKYAIRAREKSQPRFLGGPDHYARWGLENITADRFALPILLNLVRVYCDIIFGHMLSMGGSGGVAPDDPLGEFKFDVANLIDLSYLTKAIELAKTGRSIQWKRLAEWSKLPEIRGVLDELPHPGTSGSRRHFEITSIPVVESVRVKLFPRHAKPIALIDHEQILSLTAAQYDVIEALLKAGHKGLSKDELATLGRDTDAVGILRRLIQKHELWRCVIQLAGKTAGKYHIA